MRAMIIGWIVCMLSAASLRATYTNIRNLPKHYTIEAKNGWHLEDFNTVIVHKSPDLEVWKMPIRMTRLANISINPVCDKLKVIQLSFDTAFWNIRNIAEWERLVRPNWVFTSKKVIGISTHGIEKLKIIAPAWMKGLVHHTDHRNGTGWYGTIARCHLCLARMGAIGWRQRTSGKSLYVSFCGTASASSSD